MISFDLDEKNKILKMIIDFFEQERNETIGLIASEQILDFFISHLGNEIYNKAIDDARIVMTNQMDNLLINLEVLYK